MKIYLSSCNTKDFKKFERPFAIFKQAYQLERSSIGSNSQVPSCNKVWSCKNWKLLLIVAQQQLQSRGVHLKRKLIYTEKTGVATM